MSDIFYLINDCALSETLGKKSNKKIWFLFLYLPTLTLATLCVGTTQYPTKQLGGCQIYLDHCLSF